MQEKRKRKVRKKGLEKPGLRLFIIGLAILLVFLVYRTYRSKNPKSYDIAMDINIDKKARDFGIDQGRPILREKNQLVSYNKQGKQAHIRKLKEDEIVHFYQDGKAYTSIKNRLNIYSLDGDKTIDTFNAKAKITKVEVLGKNYLIYTNKTVYLYDKDFKLLEEFEIDENILSYDRLDNLSTIIGMDMNSGILTSSFYLFDENTNYYRLKSADELFIKSHYMGENKNILISNRYIYLLDKDNIVNKKLLHNFKAVDIKDDRICLIDGDELLILDNNLELIKEVRVGFDVKALSIRKNSTVLVGDKKIGIYENDNILEQDVSKVLSSVIDQSGVYLFFETGVERMSR